MFWGVVGRGWLRREVGLSMAGRGFVRFSEVANSWETLGELDKEKVRKAWKRLVDVWRC